MKNKILLFLATIVPLMAYGADTQPSDYNTTTKTMTIQTPDNLTWLATQVNKNSGSKTFEGWTITLGNNLDMSGITFIPIGKEEKLFEGVFQGNNKTISNLTFSTDVEKNIGIFGYTGTNFEVHDLTVSYSIEITSNRTCLGLLVGYNNGKVVNCTNTGNITCTRKTTENNYSCLVGKNSSTGEIHNCVNNGELNIDISIGKTLMGSMAGSNEGLIANCLNTGNITGQQSIGGIAGSNKGTIKNCINRGNISASTYVGGIAGVNSNSIDHCTNYGVVSSTEGTTGGIVGNHNISSNNSTGYLTNCCSYGNVSSTNNSNKYHVGAIIGSVGNFTNAVNNYYDSQVVVTIGQNTFEGTTPRGCGTSEGVQDIANNNGAVFSTTIPANVVGSYGWATYYNSAANMLADEGTTVYTATVSSDGEKLLLTEVADRIVKKGQGVILKRSGEGSFLLTATATAATDSYFTSNVLTGVDASTAQTTGQDYFVLGTGDNGLGFYKLSSGTDLGSHKAFVVLAVGSPVRAMLLDDSQAAAIGNVTTTQATKPTNYTDLLGRRVTTPQKGIYIVDGRKRVVR